MRRAPVLLVGPGALTPGQQRDLRRELAASVARTVHGFAPGDFDDVTSGESAWRAH